MRIIANVTVEDGDESYPPGEAFTLADKKAKDLIDRGFAVKQADSEPETESDTTESAP